MIPPLLGVTPIFAISFWVRHEFRVSARAALTPTSSRLGLRCLQTTYSYHDAEQDVGRAVHSGTRVGWIPLRRSDDAGDRPS
jgi:hypothetical protein